MDTLAPHPRRHSTIPDTDADGEPNPSAQPSKRHERKGSLSGITNYARPRPLHIPRHISESYLAFKGKQECALKIGVHELEREMTQSTGIERLELMQETLTIRLHSQSKLSQQEISDLQKATHFDKKELQQWYKGIHPSPPRPACPRESHR